MCWWLRVSELIGSPQVEVGDVVDGDLLGFADRLQRGVEPSEGEPW
jgi:hypothetical protein